MAKADDPFLRWVADLSGPLSRHQSRLVLGAYLDRLRHGSSGEVRRAHAEFFRRYWSPPSLLGPSYQRFDEVMERLRQPPRPGPRRKPNPVRVYYPILVEAGERLRARSPSLTEFRRELERWQQTGLFDKPERPLPAYRLYRLHETPERLAVAFLAFTSGKPVKQIRKVLGRPSGPPPIAG
jgi:hypothetical protein